MPNGHRKFVHWSQWLFFLTCIQARAQPCEPSNSITLVHISLVHLFLMYANSNHIILAMHRRAQGPMSLPSVYRCRVKHASLNGCSGRFHSTVKDSSSEPAYTAMLHALSKFFQLGKQTCSPLFSGLTTQFAYEGIHHTFAGSTSYAAGHSRDGQSTGCQQQLFPSAA